MCGINGILVGSGTLGDVEARVAAMNAQMAYRGPDGEGAWAEGPVCLGMRRLSIIDLEGGMQPLFNEDRSLVLVCNGEIYNHLELRSGLEERGHRFASGSDAETILHLYEEKGPDCLSDLRGMFAFLLWDRPRQRLFAARDRLGLKPLYVANQDGVLYFSSELKAILAASGLSPTLRPESVHAFLAFSYPVDPRHTPVEEVQRVLPGEYLLADASGPSYHRYWTPRFGGDVGLAPAGDAEVLGVLQEAVRLHLRSDVPVGILLSGGLDSSSIAALTLGTGASCTAISAGYLGEHVEDERPRARRTARALGLGMVEVECAVADFDAHFEALVKVCDEPVGDIAAMAQWALYREASARGFKVLLSGLGGDEIFFGYPPWNALGQTLRTTAGGPSAHAERISKVFLENQGLESLQVMAGPLAQARTGVLGPFVDFCSQAPEGPDEIAALLLGTYLTHNGCQLADKLGMGCSVEVRVPLLDHPLVEKVFGMPLGRRFESAVSKPLLRRMMVGRLPEGLLEGPKRGFSPPMGFIDRMIGRRSDALLEGQLVQSGWVDRQRLAQVLRRDQRMPWLHFGRPRRWLGIPRATWFLFRMVAFERWYEQVCAGPGR